MRIQLGFFSLLGLIFITLKLIGVITWSWWLVTLPLWFGWGVLAILFLLRRDLDARHLQFGGNPGDHRHRERGR